MTFLNALYWRLNHGGVLKKGSASLKIGLPVGQTMISGISVKKSFYSIIKCIETNIEPKLSSTNCQHRAPERRRRVNPTSNFVSQKKHPYSGMFALQNLVILHYQS
jgi:hypothetical protein